MGRCTISTAGLRVAITAPSSPSARGSEGRQTRPAGLRQCPPRELTSAGLSDASAGWHPNKGGREGQGQSPKPVPRPTVDAGAETALKLRIGACYVGSGTGRH